MLAYRNGLQTLQVKLAQAANVDPDSVAKWQAGLQACVVSANAHVHTLTDHTRGNGPHLTLA